MAEHVHRMYNLLQWPPLEMLRKTVQSTTREMQESWAARYMTCKTTTNDREPSSTRNMMFLQCYSQSQTNKHSHGWHEDMGGRLPWGRGWYFFHSSTRLGLPGGCCGLLGVMRVIQGC